MSDANSGEKGKGILSRISLDRFVSVVASLGHRTDQLQMETWRLNSKTKISSSLWREVIDELELNHDEKTRHALYHLLRSDAHKTVKLIQEKKRTNNGGNNEDDLDINIDKDCRPADKGDSSLLSVPSLPPLQRPATRAAQHKDAKTNEISDSLTSEISLAFNTDEWRKVFSTTHQRMKKDWTDVFYKKMTSNGIKCSLVFKTPYIKKGKRKRRCRFFFCVAHCSLSTCSRSYQIILRHLPDENSSVLFLVCVFGEYAHDANVETAGRQVRSEIRSVIGKQLDESS